jgi:Uma2 family endonuclease
MVTTRRAPPTLERFLRWTEREPPLEYFEGKVTRKVSPKLRHSALQLDLGKRFDAFGIPRRLARAFPELRTTFAGASFVPDVAVFTWERIPADADGELPDEVFVPPDIAIEVISPGQPLARLFQRCRWYVEHGVRLALLVHPRRRVVWLFRPGAPEALLSGGDPIDFDAVLPGFQLTVQELYRALRARG